MSGSERTFPCPRCQAQQVLSALYCSNCGLPLGAAGGPPVALPLAPPAAQSYSERYAGTQFGAPAPAGPPPGFEAHIQPKKKTNPIVGVLAVVAILVALYLVFGVPKFGGPATAGPAAANVPPAGTIWFGSSFDSTTFEVRGQTGVGKVGQTFAMVGHLTRSVQFDQLNIRISLGGTTYANQQAQVAGSGTGDVFGFTYLPPIAGSYRFDLTDIGGSVLASGTIVVR